MSSRLPRSLMLPVVMGVLVMSACDDDDDPVGPATETATATLTPMNGENAGGTVTFTLTGDQLVVSVLVDGADPNMAHAQHVHFGASCPTAAADTNSDGFIDALEGRAIYGGILIPLDGDISTQAAGLTTLPTADANGEYEWADTTSFITLLNDLTATDPDPNDGIVKLPSLDLNIDNRTVVLYGVADTSTLPATVLAPAGQTPQQALPIACGAIN
jgi:hypothetical protein